MFQRKEVDGEIRVDPARGLEVSGIVRAALGLRFVVPPLRVFWQAFVGGEPEKLRDADFMEESW